MNKNGNSGSSGNEYDNNVRKKKLITLGIVLVVIETDVKIFTKKYARNGLKMDIVKI